MVLQNPAHKPWREPVAKSPVGESSLRPAPSDARPRDRVRADRRSVGNLKGRIEAISRTANSIGRGTLFSRFAERSGRAGQTVDTVNRH